MTVDPWAFRRWAFEQETGNVGRKAVLAALASMADSETGRCEAKHDTLAQWVEISRRSVIRHVEALREAGLVATRRQYRRDGSRRGDEFLLLAPWVTEWPDGGSIQSATVAQPSQSANGSTSKVPTATPSLPPLAQQEGPLKERPLRNGSSSPSAARAWLGVPDEMRRDGVELLRQKVKVAGRVVTEPELETAAAALAEFNRQAESDFGLGANYKPIVMRIRERPSAGPEVHVRLVQSAWRLRWWEGRGNGRRATPQVIYGERAFEQVWQDAADEAHGRKRRESIPLSERRFNGRRWDELTEREQTHAKEAWSMRLEVWDGGKDAWQDRPAQLAAGAALVAANGNGHVGGYTAENILDD